MTRINRNAYLLKALRSFDGCCGVKSGAMFIVGHSLARTIQSRINRHDNLGKSTCSVFNSRNHVIRNRPESWAAMCCHEKLPLQVEFIDAGTLNIWVKDARSPPGRIFPRDAGADHRLADIRAIDRHVAQQPPVNVAVAVDAGHRHRAAVEQREQLVVAALPSRASSSQRDGCVSGASIPRSAPSPRRSRRCRRPPRNWSRRPTRNSEGLS